MTAANAPYPHEGGCLHCHKAKVCNYCGLSIVRDTGRCTNGRCNPCHRTICGGGEAHAFFREGSFRT